MPMTIEELEHKLLELPEDVRDHLAQALTESISPPFEYEFAPAQLAEFERRSREIIDYPNRGVPYEEAMARLQAMLAA